MNENWHTPFPADVLKAMNHLFASGRSPMPEAAFVEACRLAMEARDRANSEADDVVLGISGMVDPFRSMFEAGFAAGAAGATFKLSGACLEDALSRNKASGNG